MYNPWSGYRITGNWYAHRTYSYGGTDYPLAYGTPLRAPANGTFTNNGWVGSAGRRATLKFDTPIKRTVPASKTPMYGGATPYYEHNCDMVSLVFQHAKGYLGSGWYRQGALLGYSGASANGKEWGGDAHLHVHGLCVHGARVDWLKFQGSTTSGIPSTPIPDEKDNLMHTYSHLDGRTDSTGESFKLSPTATTNLKNKAGGDADMSDIAHDGYLVLTAHVYATAKPFEVLDIAVTLYDVENKRYSPHYTERVAADANGRILANPTFQMDKPSGWRAYLRVAAPSSNTAAVTVNRLAANGSLFG